MLLSKVTVIDTYLREERPRGVIPLETWETVRHRCRRDGEAIKVVARDLNLAPNTVRKYLRGDDPPARRPRPRACILDRYQPRIDDLIRSTPKITAVRVGSYLREIVDPELRIDERTLRMYVAARRAALIPKEAFIRACYAPGDQAQFDFSPMSVMLAGVLVVVQLFVMRLSYSACLFARASMRCDRPSLFAGLLEACVHFGGTPRTAIFDNATTAVTRILRGRSREENDAFAAFRGGLVLDVQFAAPGKGNEKGGVEGAHGFIEDNFFRPIPSFANLDELNVALATFCEHDLQRKQTGQSQTIGERFSHEKSFLGPLPAILPRACIVESARVNKFSEVCFESNWYSVPTRYVHRDANIEVYEGQLRIIVDDEAVAQHRRGFGKNEHFLDVRHYLDLLSHKHRAAQTALVLSDGRIPPELRALFERYRETDPRTATKRWTRVLGLLAEASLDELAQTVTHASACGTDDPEAIALLLQQRRTKTPSALLRAKLPEAARIPICPPDLQIYATATLMETI